MGLLDGLMGKAKGLGNPKTEERGQAIPKMMDINDLWDSDLEVSSNEVACTTGVFSKIAQYQVPAQTKLALGQGALGDAREEKGYIYMLTYDDTATPVEEPGMYRFYAEDIHGNQTKLLECRSEQLKAGGADFDRSKAMLLTESEVLIREDSYLTIWFKPDATDDILKTSCVWLVPTTLYKC